MQESEHLVDILGIRANTKLWPRLIRHSYGSCSKLLRYLSPPAYTMERQFVVRNDGLRLFPVVGDIESMARMGAARN